MSTHKFHVHLKHMQSLNVTGCAYRAHGPTQHPQSDLGAARRGSPLTPANRMRSSQRSRHGTHRTVLCTDGREGHGRTHHGCMAQKKSHSLLCGHGSNHRSSMHTCAAHGNVHMCERLGQRAGAGSTRNMRRKCGTLVATHLLLDMKLR